MTRILIAASALAVWAAPAFAHHEAALIAYAIPAAAFVPVFMAWAIAAWKGRGED